MQNVDRDEAIGILFGWFGNREFWVREIDDDRLLMLTELMGLNKPLHQRAANSIRTDSFRNERPSMPRLFYPDG